MSTSDESQLVVEGWVDAGGFPIVKLTKTIPLGKDELSLDSLSRYMDRWAKITILMVKEQRSWRGGMIKDISHLLSILLMICVAWKEGSMS